MKALDLYVANITEHVAGCDCDRCAAARVQATIEHGHVAIVTVFGCDPAALDGAISNVDIEVLSSASMARPWTMDDGTSLTRRELRTAELICAGVSRGEVARLMEMSPKTFDTHRSHVMRKLKVANEVQLVRLAVRSGWVVL